VVADIYCGIVLLGSLGDPVYFDVGGALGRVAIAEAGTVRTHY
jgi:hypothetical protein